jgi:hypothetical protein
VNGCWLKSVSISCVSRSEVLTLLHAFGSVYHECLAFCVAAIARGLISTVRSGTGLACLRWSEKIERRSHDPEPGGEGFALKFAPMGHRPSHERSEWRGSWRAFPPPLRWAPSRSHAALLSLPPTDERRKKLRDAPPRSGVSPLILPVEEHLRFKLLIETNKMSSPSADGWKSNKPLAPFVVIVARF